MLRQARGPTSTLVGERTNCPIPSAHERPWTRPWSLRLAGGIRSPKEERIAHRLALSGWGGVGSFLGNWLFYDTVELKGRCDKHALIKRRV
jgi:hypothetical protein